MAESELARDVHGVLEKVQQGVEVIVEQNHRPVAVIKAFLSVDYFDTDAELDAAWDRIVSDHEDIETEDEGGEL